MVAERAILEHDPALGGADGLPAAPRAPGRRARPAVLLAVGGAVLTGLLASVLLARESPPPTTALAASHGDSVVELTLDVTPQGGAAYEVRTAALVPAAARARALPGTTVPVRIDPAQAGSVAVDWLH